MCLNGCAFPFSTLSFDSLLKKKKLSFDFIVENVGG